MPPHFRVTVFPEEPELLNQATAPYFRVTVFPDEPECYQATTPSST